MAFDHEDMAKKYREMAMKAKPAPAAKTPAPAVKREATPETPVRCLDGCRYAPQDPDSGGRGIPLPVHETGCPNEAGRYIRHDIGAAS